MVKDSSVSSKIFDFFVYTFLIGLVVVTLFPILHVASISFSDPMEFLKGNISIFPRGFTLKSYQMILDAKVVPNAFKNSVFYTALGTVINVFMTILMAYPLSKKRLKFRKLYMKMVVITMFFGGGLIPTFLLIRNLGMYNTVWALVVPGAISTWNMVVMRSFFEGLPPELEESAYLDGANDLMILIRIILPLSKASIATIGLFYMVGHWNSFFPALIYLKDASRYPLQYILREIVIQGEMAQEMEMSGRGVATYTDFSVETIKYATIFISIFPMLLIYPFIQKYFVKGVMVGSLKG